MGHFFFFKKKKVSSILTLVLYFTLCFAPEFAASLSRIEGRFQERYGTEKLRMLGRNKQSLDIQTFLGEYVLFDDPYIQR
jgi:hypothetical protein